MCSWVLLLFLTLIRLPSVAPVFAFCGECDRKVAAQFRGVVFPQMYALYRFIYSPHHVNKNKMSPMVCQ